jgi:hypothetical protein
MGLLPLTYRRPAYVEKPEYISNNVSLHSDRESNASLRPVESESSGGIPLPLSFDRILEGGTCPV